jgi:uncharacterized protein with HEPN domain
MDNDADRIRDIADAVTDLLGFVAGLSEETFEALPVADRRTFRAVKNAVSEIGEAVKALSPGFCARHPGIDWRGIAGLRDIVVHRYFAVDLLRLWPVLTDEFPALLTAVTRELDIGPPRP